MALVLAPEPPVREWFAALDAQIARAPAFFDARPVIVDCGALPPETENVAGMIQAMAERGIRIIGTEGAHPSWQGVSRWGGPILANPKSRPVEVTDKPAKAAAAASASAASSAPSASAALKQSELPSLVIAESVRSGQSILHEQGDVTIVGSVASGAEIVAGGSIHVYGALRGRAIAGLSASKQARIFCRRMHAELLAIDGVYRTADGLEPALQGRAVQAWLENERMQIAALD